MRVLGVALYLLLHATVPAQLDFQVPGQQSVDKQVENLLIRFGQGAQLNQGSRLPYNNPEDHYKALVEMGEPAVAALGKILTGKPGKYRVGDRNTNVKAQAARVLARMDRARYLPIVREALKADPDALHETALMIIAGEDRPATDGFGAFGTPNQPIQMRSMTRVPLISTAQGDKDEAYRLALELFPKYVNSAYLARQVWSRQTPQSENILKSAVLVNSLPAARLLGESKGFGPFLLSVVQSNPKARPAALEGLQRANYEGAVLPLLKFFEENPNEWKYSSVFLVSNMGLDTYRKVLQAVPKLSDKIAAQIVRQFLSEELTPVQDEILTVLRSSRFSWQPPVPAGENEDDKTREFLFARRSLVMQYSKTFAGQKLMTARTLNADPEMRILAVEMHEYTGLSIEWLTPYLSDADVRVRSQAYASLSRTGSAGKSSADIQRKRLLTGLKDKDPQVRLAVLVPQSSWVFVYGVAELKKVAQEDPDQRVRNAASKVVSMAENALRDRLRSGGG